MTLPEAEPLVLILEEEDRQPALRQVLTKFSCQVEAYDRLTAIPSSLWPRAAVFLYAGRWKTGRSIAHHIHAARIVLDYRRRAPTARAIYVQRDPLDVAALEAACAKFLERKPFTLHPCPSALFPPSSTPSRLEATTKLLTLTKLADTALHRYAELRILLREKEVELRDLEKETDLAFHLHEIQRDAVTAARAEALEFYDNPADLDALLV